MDARPYLTADVRKTLKRFTTKHAYTVDALNEQGVPMPLIRLMLADRYTPVERARVSLRTRKRVETTHYVWGPDIANFLKGCD